MQALGGQVCGLQVVLTHGSHPRPSVPGAVLSVKAESKSRSARCPRTYAVFISGELELPLSLQHSSSHNERFAAFLTYSRKVAVLLYFKCLLSCLPFPSNVRLGALVVLLSCVQNGLISEAQL